MSDYKTYTPYHFYSDERKDWATKCAWFFRERGFGDTRRVDFEALYDFLRAEYDAEIRQRNDHPAWKRGKRGK